MVIINSDDFGFNPKINEAIYLAFKKGLISSTTTLVNFEEGLEDAVNYIKSGELEPNSIGLHLNLTEGIPITKGIRENTRFCQNGVFKYTRASSSIFHLDRTSKQDVIAELDAQINRFIEAFKFLPSHIDSHHHIHTEWAIIKCVTSLAKKHNINCIRLARNSGEAKDFKKKIYRNILNSYLKYHGFKTTDRFGGIEDIAYSGIKPSKNYEIMVHAAMSSQENTIVDLDMRNLEQKLIGLFSGKKWKLNNYHDLREAL